MAIVENPLYIEKREEISGVRFLAVVDENIFAKGRECAVDPHKHSHYELCFFSKGEATVVLEDGEIRVSEGCVYLIHPDKYHSKPMDKISEDAEQYSLRFKIDLTSSGGRPLKRARELEAALGQTLIINDAIGNIGRYTKQLADEMREKGNGYTSCAKALLTLILTEVVRLSAKNVDGGERYAVTDGGGRAARVERFFGLYYGSKVSLPMLGEYLSVSPRQADRIVKGEYGISFVDKLFETRLSVAKHKLRHSNEKIKDIAADCGYQSYGYFASAFKKAMGCTPAEYRKNLRM